MQLRGPDSISPETATVVGGAPAPPRVPAAPAIIALSDDPLLLEALTGAALADSAVITSPSPDRFIDQLVANAPGIALIDAATVSTGLKSFILTLHEQFPQLLLILTGQAQLQAQFSAQLADGTLFRFVHKPASSQRLKLFIDAALRQYAQPAPPAHAPHAAAAASRAASPDPPTGGRGGLALAGLSGAALAAGAIAWAVWHEASPPAASKPAAADSSTAAALASVPAPPRGEDVAPDLSALEQTDAVREATAREAAAREAAARESAALEQAQRSALGARADQLSVYLQLAHKRLASGALVEPADDSARTYLASALALAPEDADVRATSIALGEALIAQFRHALAADDSTEAQRWLQACSDYRINGSTLSELSAQLERARAPASAAAIQPPLAAPPATITATAAAAAPEKVPAAAPEAPPAPPASAASAAPAAPAAPAAQAAAGTAIVTATATPAVTVPDAVVSEGSLTRVLFVPPVYPEAALAHGIGGWVDLEFTVTSEGKVADIVVLAAQPGGVFEAAARASLAHSRYRPVQRDGVPVAQRTRIRMRFKQ